MEYNKSVDIHQSSEDVKMSSRNVQGELDRKSGVPGTSIRGVRAEAVSTANTAQSVQGGMGNTYNYYLIGGLEEAFTWMINKMGIGTQIDNNVLKSTQDTSTKERKSRVRLDNESEKQVMVEDHSQQHRHQAVTDVAKNTDTEDAATEVARDVANYILTIGTNNPKLLWEIVVKMDHLDNISYQ